MNKFVIGFLLSTTLLFCTTAKSETENITQKAHHIAHYVYGENAANVNLQHIVGLENLIKNIFEASDYQLYKASALVHSKLRANLEKITGKIGPVHPDEKIKTAEQFLAFVLENQTEHFETFSNKTLESMPFYRLAMGAGLYTFDWLKGKCRKLLKLKHSATTVEKLAKQIYEYLQYQSEAILSNHDRLTSFLIAQKDVPLPQILTMWTNAEAQQKLIDYTIKHRSGAEVQGLFIDMAMEMGEQMLIMQGGSFAGQMENQEQENKLKAINKQESALQHKFSAYQEKLQNNQSTALKGIANQYGDEVKTIQKQYTGSIGDFKNWAMYLERSVDLYIPQPMFMASPIQYDQIFSNSKMMTPYDDAWYNTNQFGDWEYDANSECFMQRSAHPFENPTSAPNNSIFTEYITGQQSYEIELGFMLIGGDLPFFVGVMFNKARWISGDPERLRQYRLVGLYGYDASTTKQATKASAKTKTQAASTPKETVSLCYAEQIILDQGKSTEKIITPLEQIVKDPSATALYSLSEAEIQALKSGPASYNLQITNSPKDVLVKLWAQGEKEPKQAISVTQRTKKSLNQDLFIYNGFGFMSPGYVSMFSLSDGKPIPAPTQSQLKKFKTKTAGLTT